MALDIEHLEELLLLLKNQGVEHFEGLGVRVSFLPSQEPLSSSPVTTSKTIPTPKSMWEHPGLWPNGKPPEFPK